MVAISPDVAVFGFIFQNDANCLIIVRYIRID